MTATTPSVWNVVWMAAAALCEISDHEDGPCHVCLAEAVRQQIETERAQAAEQARAAALEEAARWVFDNMPSDALLAYSSAQRIAAALRAGVRALARTPAPGQVGPVLGRDKLAAAVARAARLTEALREAETVVRSELVAILGDMSPLEAVIAVRRVLADRVRDIARSARGGA